MRWLARRDYSVLEMSRRLRRAGADSETSEAVIAELLEEDLLSDERFAEQFVRSRVRKSQGPVKIRAELSARGVRDDVIERQLLTDDQSWIERARNWLDTHGGIPDRDDRDARGRAYRRLMNRGFTHGQAMASMD